MNKIYAAFIASILSLGLAAQGFTLVDIVNNISGSADMSELELSRANVLNTSEEEIGVRVRKIEVSVVEGSENYFCWNACFEPTVFASGVLPIQPQSIENSFSGHFVPNGTTGVSTIRYCFSSMSEPGDECIDVVYSVTPVNIVKVNPIKTHLSNVYPNPANQNASMNYYLPGSVNEARLYIYNAIGIKVKELPVSGSSGKINIDVFDLQSGIYTAALITDGKLEISKRFVVKH
jgi:hypothetical protein